MTVSSEDFARLVQEQYDALPDNIVEAFEQIGGVAIAEWYQGDAPAMKSRGLSGLWHPALRTAFVYEHPMVDLPDVQVPGEIALTLRHEIGHALGMTHADLHRLGLYDAERDAAWQETRRLCGG